jgi:hypothetical protein
MAMITHKLGGEGRRVKHEGSRPEHSLSPAPGDTAPHPAEASVWESFLSRGNLAEALSSAPLGQGGALRSELGGRQGPAAMAQVPSQQARSRCSSRTS